jgi:hypothetical protein
VNVPERLYSNQRSLSYLALNVTWYTLPEQLTIRVCGVPLSEHIDEDEVFAKRAAQMADTSLV